MQKKVYIRTVQWRTDMPSDGPPEVKSKNINSQREPNPEQKCRSVFIFWKKESIGINVFSRQFPVVSPPDHVPLFPSGRSSVLRPAKGEAVRGRTRSEGRGRRCLPRLAITGGLFVDDLLNRFVNLGPKLSCTKKGVVELRGGDQRSPRLGDL